MITTPTRSPRTKPLSRPASEGKKLNHHQKTNPRPVIVGILRIKPLDEQGQFQYPANSHQAMSSNQPIHPPLKIVEIDEEGWAAFKRMEGEQRREYAQRP